MRVLFKEPGKKARTLIVDGSLRALQNLVGGNIEHLKLSEGLGLLCDENGKIYDRPKNFYLPVLNDWIVGNAIFVGEDGEEFTDISRDHADLVNLFLRFNADTFIPEVSNAE